MWPHADTAINLDLPIIDAILAAAGVVTIPPVPARHPMPCTLESWEFGLGPTTESVTEVAALEQFKSSIDRCATAIERKLLSTAIFSDVLASGGWGWYLTHTGKSRLILVKLHIPTIC
jgi:hypothetical protein